MEEGTIGKRERDDQGTMRKTISLFAVVVVDVVKTNRRELDSSYKYPPLSHATQASTPHNTNHKHNQAIRVKHR
jgi:hypothetical protein